MLSCICVVRFLVDCESVDEMPICHIGSRPFEPTTHGVFRREGLVFTSNQNVIFSSFSNTRVNWLCHLLDGYNLVPIDTWMRTCLSQESLVLFWGADIGARTKSIVNSINLSTYSRIVELFSSQDKVQVIDGRVGNWMLYSLWFCVAVLNKSDCLAFYLAVRIRYECPHSFDISWIVIILNVIGIAISLVKSCKMIVALTLPNS